MTNRATKPKTVGATPRGQARRAYPTSKGFQGAFMKGWRARTAGRSLDANPYTGATHGKRRRYAGQKQGRTNGTFTFAWRAAWQRGWYACDKTLKAAKR